MRVLLRVVTWLMKLYVDSHFALRTMKERDQHLTAASTIKKELLPEIENKRNSGFRYLRHLNSAFSA